MNVSKDSGSNIPRLVFTCSGIADVGEIADRAGRQLHKNGVGRMWCLAGIGAGLSNFIESTRTADKVLVIDGCPVDCGKKMMERAEIRNYSYLRVTDLGFEKGKSPATESAIEAVAAKGKSILEGGTL